MSKVRVTIDDGLDKIVALLPNTNTDAVLDLLSDEASLSETEVVAKFLNRTGSVISIETPDSSWVEKIEFNPSEGALTFISANDSRTEGFDADFSDFLDALQAPSAGKLYWEFKRGQR